MSFNRAAAVDLCNAGIAQKRAGNYQAALDYYNEAERADKTFEHIYMNMAKLLLGCSNHYAAAFHNLMIYGHLHMIDKKYNNPEAKRIVENDPGINASYAYGDSPEQNMYFTSIQINLKSEEGQKYFWQTYGEINLTRYAGACIWAQQPEKAARYAHAIHNIKSMVLGHGGGVDNEDNSDMQTTGYIYLTRNYKKIPGGIFGKDSFEAAPDKIVDLYRNSKM